MLTDTFHKRYAGRVLWTEHKSSDDQLNVQLYRIVAEQLFPPFNYKGDADDANLARWKALDSKLSMELGKHNLSQTWSTSSSGTVLLSPAQICKNFICAEFNAAVDEVDVFMKTRISFIELALREKEAQNAHMVSEEYGKFDDLLYFGRTGRVRVPGDTEAGRQAGIKSRDLQLHNAIVEVNARFAAAGRPLRYHNGLVQISTDDLIEKVIETPFWNLIVGPKWKNVETDLQEAIDRRDNGGRDPALYAAKALESVIKIFSSDLKVTTGKEKGAHNYIDNLLSASRGRFIEKWEGEQLKGFFSSVRNPLGHGPGGEPMPKLSDAQQEWAIEFVMIWTKSLIARRSL